MKFLTLAFSGIPEGYDAAGYMTRGHARLTAEGLDETHFDVVAEHLVGALRSLDVPQALIDEVVAVVAPLRAVFERNAAEHKAKLAAAEDAAAHGATPASA